MDRTRRLFSRRALRIVSLNWLVIEQDDYSPVELFELFRTKYGNINYRQEALLYVCLQPLLPLLLPYHHSPQPQQTHPQHLRILCKQSTYTFIKYRAITLIYSFNSFTGVWQSFSIICPIACFEIQNKYCWLVCESLLEISLLLIFWNNSIELHINSTHSKYVQSKSLLLDYLRHRLQRVNTYIFLQCDVQSSPTGFQNPREPSGEIFVLSTQLLGFHVKQQFCTCALLMQFNMPPLSRFPLLCAHCSHK